jgi:hypothetical protein
MLTIFLDLTVVGIGIPSWLNFAFAEYYTDPSYETPWLVDQNIASIMIIIFWYVKQYGKFGGFSALYEHVTNEKRRAKGLFILS